MKKETKFKAKDVALLRERLAWCHKKAPPEVQNLIHQTLLAFAKSISTYCQCEDKVFVERENKFACLNCGRRHKTLEGDTDLKLI